MTGVRLAGKLVVLRELHPADTDALHRVYGDADVCRYLSFTPRSRQQCAAVIDAAVTAATVPDRQVWMLAVTSRADGELVGACRIAAEEHQAAQVGLAVRPDHWRQGNGTDVLRVVQDFAFGQLDRHRVWGARSPRNTASGRLMTGAGMRPGGWLRAHVRRHGEWEDSIIHAITADEHGALRSGTELPPLPAASY